MITRENEKKYWEIKNVQGEGLTIELSLLVRSRELSRDHLILIDLISWALSFAGTIRTQWFDCKCKNLWQWGLIILQARLSSRKDFWCFSSKILLKLSTKVISYERNTNQTKYSIYSKKLNGMLFKWDGVIWGSRVLWGQTLYEQRRTNFKIVKHQASDFHSKFVRQCCSTCSSCVLIRLGYSSRRFCKSEAATIPLSTHVKRHIQSYAAQKMSKICCRVESKMGKAMIRSFGNELWRERKTNNWHVLGKPRGIWFRVIVSRHLFQVCRRSFKFDVFELLKKLFWWKRFGSKSDCVTLFLAKLPVECNFSSPFQLISGSLDFGKTFTIVNSAIND